MESLNGLQGYELVIMTDLPSLNISDTEKKSDFPFCDNSSINVGTQVALLQLSENVDIDPSLNVTKTSFRPC